MARRADFVMTETVANRTSLDQPMHAGVNLWADVSGERYEADKLDNNGSFRADAAYATAREHESGTVFLAKWNDRRSSWNGLWPTNSRKTERLSRQSGTILSQTGTLP